MYKILKFGSCKTIEKLLKRGGRWKVVDILSRGIYVESEGERILIDTGYSKYFIEDTDKFPNRFYRMATPVKLGGILRFPKVDTIMVSHFHGDHIGGLKNYKNGEKIICSKKEYEYFIQHKGLKGVLKGYIYQLLPSDFLKRAIFIEELEEVNTGYKIFDRGYRYKEFIFIELKGHTISQYGVLFNDVFYVADAIWDYKNLEGRNPHYLTRWIHYNYNCYIETINKIREFKELYNIKIISTHGGDLC